MRVWKELMSPVRGDIVLRVVPSRGASSAPAGLLIHLVRFPGADAAGYIMPPLSGLIASASLGGARYRFEIDKQ